ncbi:CrcB family protein [Sinomonas atrocyanea]|jgi:CrcB protein|uniref:fluoride efflux transporter FluC n=1 Tax=Sinomonas atrocyanea TaxID=37927 RepID=UPI0027862730|nr:CrcB family protein [Sinomonas atrocyanea]MDQ0261620.1 CrcB protein [Sinomonas atrocyanea]MDR6621521.1 CrcB protein [Sinomonas atrocyanea]
MSPLVALLLGVAGGLGAVARYVLDTAVSRRIKGPLPFATIGINVTGSLALGLVTGAVLAGADPALQAVLGTGFLGGYTTFSTASYQSVSLALSGRWAAAVVNGVGTMALCLAAALLGLAAAAALAG